VACGRRPVCASDGLRSRRDAGRVGKLELTYTRPAAVTDVSYKAEWADYADSATWSSTGVTQQILSDDGSRRTIRAVLPKGGIGQRFVRLKLAY
jgi:hypothetical protein